MGPKYNGHYSEVVVSSGLTVVVKNYYYDIGVANHHLKFLKIDLMRSFF